MDAKLHQGHVTSSRDIQNGRILSREPLYTYYIQSDIIILPICIGHSHDHYQGVL